VGTLPLAGLGEDPGLEEGFHQREHALVLDPGPHPAHNERVREVVEGRLDVRVQHPPVAVGTKLVDLGDRVVRSPPGPEPVGDRLEVRLEDGLEHELQRGLDDLVRQGGDAQLANLPQPTRLGNLALPHRQRHERARLELGAQIGQELPDPDALLDVGDSPAVHAGVFAPRLPATRANATISVAGSCTKLYRSSNRRPGSATAQR
jgi:hypothetical protein